MVEIADREGMLRTGNGAEPAGLDPQVETGQPEHNVMMALFEGLVDPDPKDNSPVPGVAERWDISPDGKVYTFHLRKERPLVQRRTGDGARFSGVVSSHIDAGAGGAVLPTCSTR